MNTNKLNFIAIKLVLMLLLTFFLSLSALTSFSQNVGINTTGTLPNEKALLDLDAFPGNDKGLLVPRLSTVSRDAITTPIPESLLIYNTTTKCFEAWNGDAWFAFGCIGVDCPVPSIVNASVSPNPVCEGSDINLVASATDATTWSWTGPNGFTSTAQNPTITGVTLAEAGVYTLTTSNACGSASAVSTTSLVVNALPAIADAGSDINPACGSTTATLAGNSPTVGTGEWSVVSGTATITDPSSPTSEVTGLAVSGTATLRWTISNSPCAASYDDVVITTNPCFDCGTSTVTFTYNGNSVTYGTVEGQNNTCWLDRNLGASQVATSKADVNAYGDLFQWGRLDDGHQIRTSGTTNEQSSTDTPGHGSFIIFSSHEWRNPQNDNLWQGVNGVNNPCPSGWRIPTLAEWTVECNSFSSNSSSGAYASPLKLTVGGRRNGGNGNMSYVNSEGNYWTSFPNATGTHAMYLTVYSSTIFGYGYRGSGFSVRCIKD